MSAKTALSLQHPQNPQPEVSKYESATSETGSKPKKLLEQVSEALRTKHYAYRTFLTCKKHAPNKPT